MIAFACRDMSDKEKVREIRDFPVPDATFLMSDELIERLKSEGSLVHYKPQSLSNLSIDEIAGRMSDEARVTKPMGFWFVGKESAKNASVFAAEMRTAFNNMQAGYYFGVEEINDDGLLSSRVYFLPEDCLEAT